jgi:putative hemolysin
MSRFPKLTPAKRTRRLHVLAAAGAVAVAASLIGAVGAADAASSTIAKPTAAAKYCSSQGGLVQYRTPAFGTNNTVPLTLASPVGFCRFSNKTTKSQVYVSLNTINSKQPTLAALAYLEKPAANSDGGTPSANPAAVYCNQLGGSDSFGGINASGGGYILKTDKLNPILETCVFPDMSSIDSWALAYHSTGAVRGKDLTKVFRYQPASLPGVFS